MTSLTAQATQAAVPSRIFGERAPFRWTARDAHTLPCGVEGALPAWLRGQLVRTAPAVFTVGEYTVAHWFDGLALLYGFRFDERGVKFQQRLLDSQMRRDLDRGRFGRASFGTALRRSTWERLTHPLPPVTDNTNVHVVPWNGAWLAMTETPHQHRIDPATLASTGLAAYEDDLPRGVATTAHPHVDPSGAMINVGTSYGRRNVIGVLRTEPGTMRRVVEGKLTVDRPFYVHDFGLSARHAVLIGQPFAMQPLGMFWSNAPISSHLHFDASRPTLLHCLDRARGTFQSYETSPLMCFHTVAAFDDGDDVVLDFLAYDDARVVDSLSTASLSPGFPASGMPRLMRARLRPGRTSAPLERLSDACFEFPCAARSSAAERYDVCFGAVLDSDGAGGTRSELVRVSVHDGSVLRFAEPGMVLGEPVLVRRPGAQEPDDGVVLAVGSSTTDDVSVLTVLDARTLEPRAHVRVPLALPLGFHGSFARAQ
jgi:beta,beta-carotene 9',10'-dioxygenase